MQKNNDIFRVGKKLTLSNGGKKITVDKALSEVIDQANAEGLRENTIKDYSKFYNQYVEFNGFQYVNQFDNKSIYAWLNSMKVSPATKRVRLKALKAVLGRMLRAKLLKDDSFKDITIKVDEQIKEGSAEEDIIELLSYLDLSNYFQLRDATAILLIWQTGIRIGTLSKLREHNLDFTQNLLICSGDIMKNHRRLVLPLGEELVDLLQALIHQNHVIADNRGFTTDIVFITSNGKSFQLPRSHNTLSKRLREYSIKYNIPNINAHAIRRGFAKRLLDEGVSVPVISKALGHSSLSTTTQYLNISEAEVIHELKRLI